MRVHRIAALAMMLALMMLTVASPAWAEEVSFSDAAHDAYRVPGSTGSPPAVQPPNPALSDPSADILAAGFATVDPTKGSPHHRSYSATMTITGPADSSYSYVVAGEFGADCQLYHLLTPGISSHANAFCGSGETRRFIGQIAGSTVVQNGTTLSATYTYSSKKLPPELAADPQLGPLFAFTCVSGLEGLGCRSHEVLDTASSPNGTFTI